ncbi:MAG TPA: sigma-70 family RNA polymerase sigma factor [Tepidisphaeraceae bacterium]
MQTADAELLVLYVEQRSERAFREIVERHTKLVHSICHRKLRDRHLAEDATQKVFMTFASKAKQLQPGPLEGYLAMMAIHISASTRRQRASAEKRERVLQERQAQTNKPTQADPRLMKLDEALDRLSEKYREPVTLRYIEGMSIEAVALALDLTPLAVKKRLMRALTQLREKMNVQGFGISMALVAGMLDRLHEPLPSHGLAARIASTVLSSPPISASHGRGLRPQITPRVALGIGAAMAITTIAIVSLSPRQVTPLTSPQVLGVTPPQVQLPPVSKVSSLALNQKLARKLPGLINQQTRFEFALTLLQDASGVPVEGRWDTIAATGVTRDTHITLQAKSSTVLEQLEAVLRTVSPSGKLECYVSEDGKIIVQPQRGSTSTSARVSAAEH